MGGLKETYFKKTVFLGGTCNETTWRGDLIKLLDGSVVNYFDPVVSDWNEEAQKREEQAKKDSDFCLYVITPKMTGVFSIAEVVDDSNKKPAKTLFVVLPESDGSKFDKGQLKSLDAVKEIIIANGATVYNSLSECADFLNKL